MLGIYLVALFGLLMFPIGGPSIRLLSIGADKWMHVALFGGLAIFLRWNISADRYAVTIAVGIAFVVAVAAELAQSLVAYRSADLLDVVAGLVGAILGALCMNQIVALRVPERIVGVLAATLGLMVGVLFLLADVIGVGDSRQFGVLQIGGTALGALITAGGIGIYMRGLRSKSPAA